MSQLISVLGSATVVTATGGTANRTLGDRFADHLNAKDLGAVGDGPTDDHTAIDAAAALGAIRLPAGVFSYPGSDFGAALGSKRIFGEGRVKTGANKRARYFSALTAAPSSYGNPAGIDTAFNGDLSRVQFDIEHRITGSTTLTQPSSGYVNKPETAAIYAQFYNSSGYNSLTSGNTGGRTMAAFEYRKITQAGQADCVAQYMEAVISSAKSGATHFLANPAVGLWAGQMTAAVDGCYLNPYEVNLQANGYDCAAVGAVNNLSRSVASSALSTYWGGVRIQSKGAAAIDDAYYASGKMNAGLNLLLADFSVSGVPVAVALKAGQRIYGNGVQSDLAGFAVPSFGAQYFGYETADAAWKFVGGVTMNQGVGTSRTLQANGDITLEFTNNTTVTLRGKGSDGTVRSGTITLS
jgi:hypothetical protein